jgi:hypothetical protein
MTQLLLEYIVFTCADCGELCPINKRRTSADGEDYCPSCYEEKYTSCANCGEELSREDARTSADGVDYCQSCYDDNFTTCHNCQNEVSTDKALSAGRRGRDEYDYCPDCFNELFARCCSCGNVHPQDDCTTDDSGETYCADCYSEYYTSCEQCGAEISRDDAIYTEDSCYCGDCAPSGNDREWEPACSFRPSASYREIGSHRKFGIELETSQCSGFDDLEGDTVFGAKEDGSISGMEFVSPVLSSDAGLDEIRDFCRRADYHNFDVDSKCGFHAHFDVRDLSVAQLKSVCYAYHKTYCAWSSFVPEKRRENHYCREHCWTTLDLDEISDFEGWNRFAKGGTWNYRSDATDRYAWINVKAYARHGTLEVRLHTATLEQGKICNWVKAHARFIDCVRNLTFKQIDSLFGDNAHTQFNGLSKIWKDGDLTDFYAKRAAKFGTHYIVRETVTTRETVAA